jgi:hypothetical protein
MRTKLTTTVSIAAAGAFVWALATPAQAGTQDSGWQRIANVSTDADPAADNNGNS